MALDFDQLYPGKFIKAGEFEGKDVTYKIAGVTTEELEGMKGLETKAIVSLEGSKKSWVMNKTNGTALKALWGRNTGDWVGRRVTLYPANILDRKTKKMILAIRVKGSPDMAQPSLEFTEKVGKEQVVFKLVRTGQQQRQAATQPQAADPALDKRRIALWTHADSLGMKATFQEWATKQLGVRKPWKNWTADEVTQLEEAFLALEPPANDSPPPDDAPPPDAAEVQHG